MSQNRVKRDMKEASEKHLSQIRIELLTSYFVAVEDKMDLSLWLKGNLGLIVGQARRFDHTKSSKCNC